MYYRLPDHSLRKVGKCLSVFFKAKTHKPDSPFRTIISESGCWQKNVSQFLQKNLKLLTLNDPFRTKNSNDVVQFLRGNTDVGYGFSVDVEDLFYSVPQRQLLSSVHECIEYSGTISFQNHAGVSVGNFLSLLEYYLRATFIVFNDQPYLQRNGICIGSCVAPVLVDIFLSCRISMFADGESKLDYETVAKKFEEYCVAQRNEVHERYLFRKRVQNSELERMERTEIIVKVTEDTD
ncbi:uncharacterized protein [Dermacentor andersoni]|uniref:uncharacterized protein n=1 Tax=Dermacentor andersoni TaxID=34620 RepID=UPI003B3B9BB5